MSHFGFKWQFAASTLVYCEDGRFSYFVEFPMPRINAESGKDYHPLVRFCWDGSNMYVGFRSDPPYRFAYLPLESDVVLTGSDLLDACEQFRITLSAHQRLNALAQQAEEEREEAV